MEVLSNMKLLGSCISNVSLKENEDEYPTRKSAQIKYSVIRSTLFFASQCHFSSSLKERIGTLGHKLGLKVRLDDTMWQGKLDL